MRIYLQLAKLKSYMAHRRITAFWVAAALSLTVPWILKGCQVTPAKNGSVYEDCAVLSIYDGDTMTVRCDGAKMKIRLYCIDAPEMAQKPWGKQSLDHLRNNTPPTVQIVVHTQDRYGRNVGEVLVDNGRLNLNQLQVQDGQAAIYGRYCTDREYSRIETAARSSRIGIWSKPGLQQEPWVWRR